MFTAPFVIRSSEKKKMRIELNLTLEQQQRIKALAMMTFTWFNYLELYIFGMLTKLKQNKIPHLLSCLARDLEPDLRLLSRVLLVSRRPLRLDL